MSDALRRAIAAPSFLDEQRYKEPPPPGKQWRRRKMEPDVTKALTAESLRQVHPEPDSEDGKRVINVFNLIAFGYAFDRRVSKASTSKKRYGELCRAAIALYGIDQDQFEQHVRALLDRGVLHVKHDQEKRMTANVFLSRAVLADGTKERSEDVDAAAETDAEPVEPVVRPRKRYRLPEFLKEDRFRQPPLADRKSYRRRYKMSEDARVAFNDETKALFHDNLASQDAQQRFVLFNIVAFGAKFVSGVSSLQANQVSYRQLIEAAEHRGLDRDTVDRQLWALLERRLLFTCLSKAGDITLTASAFLQNAELAEPHQPLQVHPYERLRIDSASKIEMPPFLLDEQYAYQCDDDAFLRSSRFTMPSGDVCRELHDVSLQQIDPILVEKPESDGATLVAALFNFIVFGPCSESSTRRDVGDGRDANLSERMSASGVAFSDVCRFGMHNNVEYDTLIAQIRALLERQVVKVRVNLSTGQAHLTAFPFMENVWRSDDPYCAMSIADACTSRCKCEAGENDQTANSNGDNRHKKHRAGQVALDGCQ